MAHTLLVVHIRAWCQFCLVTNNGSCSILSSELVDGTNSARHLAVHVAFQCIIKFESYHCAGQFCVSKR